MDPFSNYLREGIESFDVLSLNRFGGAPEGDPGTVTSNEARGRFSSLACLALRAALISLRCGFEVLGLVWRAWSSLLHLLRAFALLAASLESPLPHILNPLSNC